MAISYGFFNSVNGDRRYNADQIGDYFTKLISNGVFADPSTNLQVLAGAGMSVNVSAGWGFINCKWLKNDTDLNLPIDAADVALRRIDRVVLKLNAIDQFRSMTIEIKKGTPAASPVAPTLLRNSSFYELSLATISIAANATSIAQSAITDNRANTSLCGYVTGLIDQIDTTNLFAQYDNAFNTWFDNVRETLSTSTLIRQYTSSYTTTTANEITIPINISQFNINLDVLNVYISGMKLIQNVDYTKHSGTITLANPLDVVGTSIEFEVLKSIDGSDAESIVDMVYQLQEEIGQNDRNIYYCNGVNDNTELMNYISNWEHGSTVKDRISVVGTFGVDNTTITASDGANYSFVYECDHECGITIDFSGCDEITARANNFMYVSGCTVENMTVVHDQTIQTAERFDIVCNNAKLERVKVHGILAGTGTDRIFKPINSTLIECECNVATMGVVVGITPISSTCSNCKFNVISNGASTSAYGGIMAGISRFDNCDFIATATGTGSTSSGRGVNGGGNYSNCLFVGRGRYGYGCYTGTDDLLSASNCVFRGYTSSTSGGIGLTGNTNSMVILMGVNCNKIDETGYRQNNSMSFTTGSGSYTGCFYTAPTTPATMVSFGTFVVNKV